MRLIAASPIAEVRRQTSSKGKGAPVVSKSADTDYATPGCGAPSPFHWSWAGSGLAPGVMNGRPHLFHNHTAVTSPTFTPVPNNTAWWQRHTGVNNLPRVVTQQRPAGDRTRDLLIASPTLYRCVTIRHPQAGSGPKTLISGTSGHRSNTPMVLVNS